MNVRNPVKNAGSGIRAAILAWDTRDAKANGHARPVSGVVISPSPSRHAGFELSHVLNSRLLGMPKYG
jgi:hypothetical protein